MNANVKRIFAIDTVSFEMKVEGKNILETNARNSMDDMERQTLIMTK